VPILVARCRIELQKFAVLVNAILGGLRNGVIDFHNGRLIATTITIVGSREHRNDAAVVLPLVAFHDELMGAGDKVKAVEMGELHGNVFAKSVAGTTGRNAPSGTVARIVRNIEPPNKSWSTYRSSGSLHTKSHMGPSCGTSCTRSKSRA